MHANKLIDENRRTFIKLSGAAAAGLTLGIYFPKSIAAETADSSAVRKLIDVDAFVNISPDNIVTIVSKHIEFGQGTFTGLGTIIADEMDADWSQIRLEHAPADASHYANLNWGAQGTGGSSAINNSWNQHREIGAAARQMLMGAAAERWSVPVQEITVSKGVVSHRKSNYKASFGELAEAAAKQPVPGTVKLKEPKDFTLIGKDFIPRKDTGKTNGSAVFTQDINLPNQLTAVIAHPPLFGATVASYDATETKKIEGVIRIVKVPTGVAVLAKDFWTAKKGRDVLKIQWDKSKAFKMSSGEIMAQYKQMAKEPGLSVRKDGDPDTAFKKADKIIERAYEFPYLAHAAMEPMNCVVDLHDNGVDLWYGCQSTTGDQMAVAGLLGLKPQQVKINTLYAGGSFGRRASSRSDYVLEAVNIAKAVGKGTPVKLVWTREDDTRAGYFRPMYYHVIKAGIDKRGKLIAWQHRIVGQSIFKGTGLERLIKNGIDYTSVEGAHNLPYAIPNMSVELSTPENIHVPVLWWRSVGSTHTAFSTEAMIDEIATVLKKDPVVFRMRLLKEHPHHQRVLKLAAEKAGWSKRKRLGKGRAMGIAVHESFKSYVAEVAEVSVKDDGGFSVDKIVCAVDCGVAINPDVIRAQMEGGIGFGLSTALVSAMTLEEGHVKESNFHDYLVLRMNQMPEIEVHILPSAEAPTGVGEPGTPVAAPAVANALFAATGKRYYNMPFRT